MPGLFLSVGAGPGIALSTARNFAAEGFRVVLAARHADRLEQMAAELREVSSADVEVATVDCSDSRQVGALVDRYAKDLEVIHYNAAVIRSEKLSEQALETIPSDIEVNISSALVAIKQATAAMAPRTKGTILLTGGILGVKPVSDLLTLSVGKAGLRCAAQALFPELAAQGVHIAVLTVAANIAPGSMNAEGVGKAFWELYAQPRDKWTWEGHFG